MISYLGQNVIKCKMYILYLNKISPLGVKKIPIQPLDEEINIFKQIFNYYLIFH